MNEAIKKNEYMSSLFRYIENNMPFDLDTKLLSGFGYVSHAKLYRDFYSISGHSVKEYVRKRRLSNALALIKSSDFSVTDIALQCGYSSHQALCRAVRETLGLTPSEYKSGDVHYFFPPFSGEPLQSVTVANETIPRMLCVLFYHSRLLNIENMAVSTFLSVIPDYGGRIFGRNGKQNGGKFCYELYLTDTGRDYGELKSYGFERTHEISCSISMFATSTVPNDERKINAAWDYLYSEWLQNSMFEYTDKPYYEEYILKNNKPVKLKLYLPIKRRTDETKITLTSNPGLSFIVSRANGYNAERTASKTVIDYLNANHPYIVKTSKEFYVKKSANSYVCGVRVVNTDMRFENGDAENVELIAMCQNKYLVLESGVMGDYDRYAELLLSFALDNNIAADINGIFAVYDARKSFDNLKIKMYCPIK